MCPLQREKQKSIHPRYRRALDSRRSFWRTNSAKGRTANSWSNRAPMGTRAAALSSSDRAEGSVGADKLGGNLLKDISMCISLYWRIAHAEGQVAVGSRCLGPHIPDYVKVKTVIAVTILGQKKLELLLKGCKLEKEKRNRRRDAIAFVKSQ